MPNPFAPKPGSTWRNPPSRTAKPQAEDASPRGLMRGAEPAWRSHVEAWDDTIPADTGQPTAADLRILACVASILLACVVLVTSWHIHAERKARERAACVASMPEASVADLYEACGGPR